MSRNNSPARRAQRAQAAAIPQTTSPAVTATVHVSDETPRTLTDRVIRRLCWRARGWAWKAGLAMSESTHYPHGTRQWDTPTRRRQLRRTPDRVRWERAA